MDFTKIPTTFNVTMYGDMQPVTDTTSKCRVRIFYRGMNRNRTFISEDFANQLIASLPYAPVKGIFDYESVDYTDHGDRSEEGRIYGLVMAEPNFAWEDHEDDDGVVRSYACADVLVYTALYPEAKIVLNSSQSMEIYPKTLKGSWKISEIDNQPYFNFEQGSLLGLQILGQDTEPCFEGSAFFSLKENEPYLELANCMSKNNIQEENEEMEKTLFQILEGEQASLISEKLNPNFSETGTVEKVVISMTDNSVVCYDMETKSYQNISFSVAEDGGINVGEATPVSAMFSTEEDMTEIANLKTLGSFEQLSADIEKYKADIESLTSEKTAFEADKVTMQEQITALETEKAQFTAEIEKINSQISELSAEKVEFEKKINDLTNENAELSEFKKKVEDEQKKKVLEKCERVLSDDVIQEFSKNIGSYSVADFEKEVYATAVRCNPTIFSQQDAAPDKFYKGETLVEDKTATVTGVMGILNNYKTGGNK